MNTLYILCGFPYSGKTVLAKELSKKLGFVRVDIDEIILKHGYKSFDDKNISKDNLSKMFDVFYTEIINKLRLRKNVICDNSNPSRKSRNIMRKIDQDNNSLSKVIYVDVSKETIKKRWLENKYTRDRSDIREKTLIDAFEEMEVPIKDENMILYNPSTDLDIWIKNNF